MLGLLLWTVFFGFVLLLGGARTRAVEAPGPAATRTAFLPLSPGVLPTASIPAEPVVPGEQQAPPTANLDGTLWGIDFRDAAPRIVLDLLAPETKFHHARPLRIAFRPGWPCEYLDRRACITRAGGHVLVTVHSGVGGDGQALRHFIEGTGLNRAAFPLEEIAANLSAMRGAPVDVSQGEAGVHLRVLATVRVSPEGLASYLSAPLGDVLASAASTSPGLQASIDAGRPLLVIETCGWRHPDEEPALSPSDTTGSIYLLVLGE